MKVIKEGPAFLKDWTAQVECTKCQTVVEVNTNDIKVTENSGDWYNSTTTTLTWNCPLCDQYNYLRGETRKSFTEGHPKMKIYG